MRRKSILLFLTLLMVALMLSGCVPGDGSYSIEKPANFLTGIWHGWIAPLSLILSIFKHNIKIYEAINTGWWYDFGFYIAIIGGGFGGLSLSRSRSKKNDKCK